MKVKRMGITEILRRIWLFSANKTKISKNVSKQPTQLIIAAHNCHIGHSEGVNTILKTNCMYLSYGETECYFIEMFHIIVN